MPQKKQTDDEIYNELVKREDATRSEPTGKGDNIDWSPDDEPILDSMYPPREDEPTNEYPK